MSVHQTAIIYPNVDLGNGAIVEPFAILGIQDRFHPPGNLTIGLNSFIGSRCTLYAGSSAGDQFDVSDQTTIFTMNKFGNNVRIGPKATIKNECSVGNNVRINSHVFMERVVIGDNVFIGPHTVFTDDIHPPCPRYADCVPKTNIGSFVSIGANVTIAPGITVGHHCQIYAGAVVLSDIPSFSVVAGNPARVIKDFRDLVCKPGYFDKPYSWWDQSKELL